MGEERKMNFCDINPFIRFAERIYHNRTSYKPVLVKDCRIFYSLSGKAEIFIENEHYELIPGSIFYCRAGSIYNIRTSHAELISLNFDLTQENNARTMPYSRTTVRDGKTLPTIHFEFVYDSEFINSHLFVAHGSEYIEPLKAILEEYSTQKIYYQENSSAILKSLLTKLHRHSIESTSNATHAVSKLIAYVKANYNKPLNNEDLSSMTGYHEYHLNRLFTKHTGTSVHQYILNIRINEAKKLLLNTNLSLTSIAEQIGFNSNTYFSTYFKRVVGISPLEFRKRFKNKI